MENNSKKLLMAGMSRRKFMATAATAAAGFTILPSGIISAKGRMAPSDKLNIVGIGVGGMGFANLKNMESENIIGLCDVDWKYSARVFDYFPKARKFKDFRKMYDEMGKSIDAVVVATADHTHALAAAHGMTMGKHVYVQKPLTHSVYESRLLARLADKYQVATQMGNQGASGPGVRQAAEWLWNNEIGEVTKVESFTNRPIWPQGLSRPEKGMWVPDTLDWDLFVGSAPMRPYHELYTPWNWRGWWDYGTGALGDMACHILHPVFVGLKLKYPIMTQGTSTTLLTESAPNAQMVRMTFPERAKPKDIKMKLPEVEVIWYDGGLQPPMPEGWPAGKEMNDSGGGVIFHGTKDKLICGCYGKDPWLLSGRTPSAPKKMRVVDLSHEMDWVRACKESPENRVQPVSYFGEAGPFNEMVVMGVMAVRLQELNKTLEWDGENMRFTNIGENDTIKTVITDSFSIHDGHPTFDTLYTEPYNAKQFAEELVRHNYREPWKLPEMPA